MWPMKLKDWLQSSQPAYILPYGDVREKERDYGEEGKNERESTQEAVNISKDPKDYHFYYGLCNNTIFGCKINLMDNIQ